MGRAEGARRAGVLEALEVLSTGARRARVRGDQDYAASALVSCAFPCQARTILESRPRGYRDPPPKSSKSSLKATPSCCFRLKSSTARRNRKPTLLRLCASKVHLPSPAPWFLGNLATLIHSYHKMSFLLSPMRRASAPSTFTSAARAFSTSSPAQVARMTLVGRLGTDPELIQTNKGGDVIKYVVGTGYGPRENRQTSWFRVASFAQEGSPLRDLTMGLSKGQVLHRRLEQTGMWAN
jgi:Single-strand binding protein family